MLFADERTAWADIRVQIPEATSDILDLGALTELANSCSALSPSTRPLYVVHLYCPGNSGHQECPVEMQDTYAGTQRQTLVLSQDFGNSHSPLYITSKKMSALTITI